MRSEETESLSESAADPIEVFTDTESLRVKTVGDLIDLLRRQQRV